MSDPAEAYVVHSMPGRLRLRIPSRRGDDAYFAQVAERLRDARHHDLIVANPYTGSLLIEGPMAQPGRIGEVSLQHNLFRLCERPAAPNPVMWAVGTGWAGVKGVIRRSTSDVLDATSLFILIFIGLGLLQMSRGRFAGPATTMFWYAANLARLAAGKWQPVAKDGG